MKTTLLSATSAVLLLVNCGGSAGPAAHPLFGDLRDVPDPTTHAPPFCVPGTNCTLFETACVEAFPDGAGGVWCRATNKTNPDDQDLVHSGPDGREVSRERLGRRSYPRLAVSSTGAVAGANDIGLVTFGGQPEGTGMGGSWVAVRTGAGQGWRHYFSPQVTFADLVWAPDGSLLALGSCTGTHTAPLALSCDTNPGTSLFTFSADGTSISRRALPTIASPRRLLLGAGGAQYVVSAAGSTMGVTLARIDVGHEWSFSYGNANLGPDGVSALVAPDGQVWLGLIYPPNSKLTIGTRTVGGSGFGGGTGIAIVNPAGVLTSLQATSSSALGEGLVGFAALPNGNVLGCWTLVTAQGTSAGGSVGSNLLPRSSLVQFLPTGEWRGLRATTCDGIVSDAAGRVVLVAPVSPELTGRPAMIRIDPT